MPRVPPAFDSIQQPGVESNDRARTTSGRVELWPPLAAGLEVTAAVLVAAGTIDWLPPGLSLVHHDGAPGVEHAPGAVSSKQALTPADIAGAVLVVDDDISIRSAIRDVLELEGYRVITAANGAEALAVVERGRPAAVLLDMRMPVLDGWGFAEAVHARGIDVPICVMTAAQDTARWASEVGADGYLEKPFNLVDLLDEIERIIRRV